MKIQIITIVASVAIFAFGSIFSVVAYLIWKEVNAVKERLAKIEK